MQKVLSVILGDNEGSDWSSLGEEETFDDESSFQPMDRLLGGRCSSTELPSLMKIT